MKNRMTTPLVASLGAVALVMTLFLSFYFSTSAYRSEDTGIILPSNDTAAPNIPDTQIDTADKQEVTDVVITKQNVQNVIASLTRPQAYSYSVQNTVYYEDTSKTIVRKQYVKSQAYRTDELHVDGSIARSSIQYSGHIYAWKSGESTYYIGQIGAFTSDAQAMLPTYETVLALEQTSILDAGMINLNYEPCVFVKAQEGEYTNVYYVSAVSGLLLRAEIWKDEQKVRSCVLSSLSTEAPIDSYFTLPDNQVIFDIKD